MNLEFVRPELLSVDSRTQPRKNFEGIDSLMRSIEEAGGILQPLVARRSKNGSLVLVCGERRLRASILLGLASVPVVVREMSVPVAAAAALAENQQREELTVMEQAFAARRLKEEHGYRLSEISCFLGKQHKESTVSNLIRLTLLPEACQSMLNAGQISQGHGKALLVLVESRAPRFIHTVARYVARNNWTVRRTEEFTRLAATKRYRNHSFRTVLRKFRSVPTTKDEHPSAWTNDLSDRLQCRVRYYVADGNHVLEFDYYSVQELAGQQAKLLGVAEDEVRIAEGEFFAEAQQWAIKFPSMSALSAYLSTVMG